MIADISQVSIHHCSREINVMARSVKAVATLASLALLACSVFAVSWVGLALLAIEGGILVRAGAMGKPAWMLIAAAV